MLKLSKKSWVFIFIAIFVVGFALGYFELTFKMYNSPANSSPADSQTFWQLLNPF